MEELVYVILPLHVHVTHPSEPAGYNWRFWEEMTNIECNVVAYIANQTAELAEKTDARQIGAITSSMADAIEGARYFGAYIAEHKVNLGDFQSELSAALNSLSSH